MKRYKGSEIIKKVEDKEIIHGAKIKSDDGDIFTYNADDSTFYWEKSVGGDRVPVYTFLKHTFELIEDNTIDIDSIEEMTRGDIANIDGMANERIKNKFNEIILAIKQLNKEIKELKK